MAKVDDATTATVTGLKCEQKESQPQPVQATDRTTGFKIFEDGLDSNGTWGVDRMIANEGNVSMTIPKCLPAGQYDFQDVHF